MARSCLYGEMKAVIDMHDASAKSLETWVMCAYQTLCTNCQTRDYLANAPDVFVAGFLVKSQVLVETKAHVVPI